MTVRFVADENIRRSLVSALKRQAEGIDIARVQDVGLRSADDPTVLAWAADHGRVLLSHDIRTIPAFAYQRVAAGLAMPGVIIVNRSLPMATVISELAMIAGASDAEEWVSKVVYLPLR